MKSQHYRIELVTIPDPGISTALARTSEKMLINKLFSSDRALREGQIVVDWLEANARYDFESKARMDYFSDGLLAFENTLAVLKDQSKGDRSYRRPIVSQLDPDAPRREGKPLHDQDVQDQTQMLKTMFLCIRAGLLETAQELCIKMGQAWRAAALEGWKLFHDPNYEEGERRPDEKLVAGRSTNSFFCTDLCNHEFTLYSLVQKKIQNFFLLEMS